MYNNKSLAFQVDKKYYLGHSYDSYTGEKSPMYLGLTKDPDTPAMLHYKGDTCTVWLADDCGMFGGCEYDFPLDDHIWEKFQSLSHVWEAWVNRYKQVDY